MPQIIWFFENFYEKYAYSALRNGTTREVHNLISHLRSKQNYKFQMTASGFSTLQDYHKLERARKDAKQANLVALSALVVTIIVGIIQIYLQVKCE
jgi:hypothetical protein